MLENIIDAIVWMYKAMAIMLVILGNLLMLAMPWVLACANGLTVGGAIVCVAVNLLWLIFTAGMLLEE